MPGPGFPVANKILYKYEQDRAYRLHRQKVRGGGGDEFTVASLCYEEIAERLMNTLVMFPRFWRHGSFCTLLYSIVLLATACVY